MPVMIVIIISTLLCPSTWVLVAVFFLFLHASPDLPYKNVIAWLVMLGTILHAARELIKDMPWLSRSAPPPGLHCTIEEWNSEFVGKPLFVLQMAWLTAIRGLTLYLLIRWIVAYKTGL